MKKENEYNRLKNFLKDDLVNIQMNLSEIKDETIKYNLTSINKNYEKIEDIISYWFRHYKSI
jgi:formiminotetrahydrofolate cyclodeaminase